MRKWAMGLCLAIVVLWSASAQAQGAFAFGVRPNTISPQAAYFGYSIGRSVVLMGGIQWLGGGIDVDYNEWDDYWEEYDRYSAKFDGSLWIPSVGIKYYLYDSEQVVSPYIAGSVFTIIPTADGAQALEDAVDEFSSYGASLAFGAEYFFHRQFSIGAEFGLNVFFAGYEEERDEISIDLEATYAAMSLNFFL